MSLDINAIISSGLLELYVAGLTSAEESRQIAAWAAQYPAVLAEIRAIETAVEAHAQANAITPPAHVKEKLLASIAAPVSVAPPPTTGKYRAMDSLANRQRRWKWVAAASVLLLIGFWGLYKVVQQRPTDDEPLVAAKKDTAKKPSFSEIIQEHMASEASMKSGDFVKILLDKAPNAPVDCDAAVYWNKQSGELYFDPCHLPLPPAGKQYQLWAIVNGRPITAGVVITDGPAGKYVIQKMTNCTTAESFAVTLEKKGGSIVPTTKETYVAGKA